MIVSSAERNRGRSESNLASSVSDVLSEDFGETGVPFQGGCAVCTLLCLLGEGKCWQPNHNE